MPVRQDTKEILCNMYFDIRRKDLKSKLSDIMDCIYFSHHLMRGLIKVIKSDMRFSYPIPPDKSASSLKVHWPLNGITLHVPLTHRKVKTSRPRIRVKKQAKFTLFAVIVAKSYTKFLLIYALIPLRDMCMVMLVILSHISLFPITVQFLFPPKYVSLISKKRAYAHFSTILFFKKILIHLL